VVAAVTLVLDGVSYRYAGAGTSALTGIDLKLEPGRAIGVVGANGAGKSTLCLVAAGLAPRTIGGRLTGTVNVDELDTAVSGQSELAQRAGILFQEPELQLASSAPTVWEEVAFGPRNLSLPQDEVVDRTWDAIETLDIGAIADRDPAHLSGGQAQLVAIAGVLALRPRYLVLDEPTSQLDPHGSRLVSEALERVRVSTGAGMLIVEHRSALLEALCDEIVVVNAGRIALTGTAGRVLADPRLEQWGIAPPPAERLRRAVESAGLAMPTR